MKYRADPQIVWTMLVTGALAMIALVRLTQPNTNVYPVTRTGEHSLHENQPPLLGGNPLFKELDPLSHLEGRVPAQQESKIRRF